MTRWVAGTAMLAIAVAGCATTRSPTYTTGASVKFRSCRHAALAPHRGTTLRFTVHNGSRRSWPATYVLLSLQGAIKGAVSGVGGPRAGLGGGVTRVRSSLAPGQDVAGTVSAYLDRRAAGTITLGAWGAPANSVAVPTSYPTASCTIHP